MAAPVSKGEPAGEAVYMLENEKLGSVPIVYMQDAEKATYRDYLKKTFERIIL